MATDFTKMPPQILVELINLTNGISLRVSDITYGPVSAVASGNRNSGITIFAAPNTLYEGSRDLTYNRIRLSDIIGNRSVVFDRNGATFVSHLIPQINAAYALNLQPEDYYNDPLPPPDSGEFTSDKRFLLRARPGSYVWIHSTEFVLRGNKIPLRSIWGVNVLGGFEYEGTDLSDTISVKALSGFNYPSAQSRWS